MLYRQPEQKAAMHSVHAPKCEAKESYFQISQVP